MELKTNKKGEWAAGGLARGDWQVDFEFPTYESRRISLSLKSSRARRRSRSS